MTVQPAAQRVAIAYLADAHSLADITYIPFFVRRERYKGAIDDNLPHLKAWMDRLLTQAVVRATS